MNQQQRPHDARAVAGSPSDQTNLTGGSMQTTWVLSANAGRARFFSESDPAAPLEEVQDMINSAMRERVLDASETDKLGPTAAAGSSHNIGGTEGVGFAHNAKAGAPNKLYQPAQTPAEHEAEKFAKDICKFLTEAHQAGRFQQLVVSASPQFLGALRGELDNNLKHLIKFEVNKDYTHCNAQELREQLLAQMSKAH
jgi:protein required for attachment to host cells